MFVKIQILIVYLEILSLFTVFLFVFAPTWTYDMSDIVVFNQYDNRFTSVYNDGETGYDTDLCDPVGYEPFNDQLADLFSAGENLDEYLAQQYPNGSPVYPPDGEDGEDGENIDPSPYAFEDTLDALQQSKDVSDRLNAQAKQTQPATTSVESTPSSTPAPSPAEAGN